MKTPRRKDWPVGFATSLALLASPALGAGEPPQPRCRTDALERWFCASDPRGVAVMDATGVVTCAAGNCVEVEDEWKCSDVPGGEATLTPEGPVCEGGCRAPRAAECDLQ